MSNPVQSIKSILLSGWTQTAIAFPREPFDPPYDNYGNPLPWIYFDPESVHSKRVGVSGVYDQDGTICIHVLVPVGKGDTQAESLREALRSMFSGVISGSLRIEFEDEIADGGTDDAGNYSVSHVYVRHYRVGAA